MKRLNGWESAEDREKFFEQLEYDNYTDSTKSIWYPYKPKDDTGSIEFV